MQRITCFCKKPLYKGETHEWDSESFCSYKCMEKYKKIKDWMKKGFKDYEDYGETLCALGDE